MPYSLASFVVASLAIVAALASLAHALGAPVDVEKLARSLALVLVAVTSTATAVRRINRRKRKPRAPMTAPRDAE